MNGYLQRHLPAAVSRNLPARRDRMARLAPVAFGGCVVLVGAVLSRVRPAVLDLPDSAPLGGEPRGRAGRAIVGLRDGAHRVAPQNMSAQLGRSLMLAGAAMLTARLLDELADRQR
ncbi:hypothetical protein [Pseudooceanicola aestuarii]|uniref:hypothetical protein n=1 Tax=Pseudooceanicola aestuarii TaxID=2697319 RepID=UPI0013D7AD33|nr:hypothetical protein [Pseudooceanicola aestuarii]